MISDWNQHLTLSDLSLTSFLPTKSWLLVAEIPLCREKRSFIEQELFWKLITSS